MFRRAIDDNASSGIELAPVTPAAVAAAVRIPTNLRSALSAAGAARRGLEEAQGLVRQLADEARKRNTNTPDPPLLEAMTAAQAAGAAWAAARSRVGVERQPHIEAVQQALQPMLGVSARAAAEAIEDLTASANTINGAMAEIAKAGGSAQRLILPDLSDALVTLRRLCR